MEPAGWTRSDSTQVNKNMHPLAFWKKPTDVTSMQLLGLKMDHAANGNEKWHLLTHSLNNICRYCIMCVKCHLAQQNLINLSSFHHTFCSAEPVTCAVGKMFCSCHGWLEKSLISTAFVALVIVRPDSRGAPTGSLKSLHQHSSSQRKWGRTELPLIPRRDEVLRISYNQALMGEIGFSFPWVLCSREPSCLEWSYSHACHDFMFQQAGTVSIVLESWARGQDNADVTPFLLLNLLQGTPLVPWLLHQ